MATTPTRCYYWLGGDSLDVTLFKRFLKASRKPTFTTLYYDDSYGTREESRCSRSDLSSLNKRGNERKKKLRNRKSRHLITTNEYLKIMAKQCSLPDVKAIVDEDNNKQRHSETYFNTSTPFRTKYIVNTVSLDPKNVPSKCLSILKHPLTQAQLRIYRSHSPKEKGACHSCNSDAIFEVMRNVQDCHKKDSREVSRCEPVYPNEKKPRKTRKEKVPVKKGNYDLLTPLAGQTLEKRKLILKGSEKTVLPLQVATNSLKTIHPTTKYLPPEQKVASSKAKLQKPSYILPIRPAKEKSSSKNERVLQILPLDKNLPKDKNLVEKIKVQPAKISPDELHNHGLLAGEETVPGRKLLVKVRKDTGLPTELKTATTTVQAVEINIQENTSPIRATVKTENFSSKKSTLKKKKEAKTTSLTQRLPCEKLLKAKADGLKRNTLNQKEKVICDLLEFGIPLPKNITTKRNLIGNVRKHLSHPQKLLTTAEIKRNPSNNVKVYTRLERKTALEKERFPMVQAEKDKALPEVTTKPEKVRRETEVTSQKINKPKAVGFRTPVPKTKTDKEMYKPIQASMLIDPSNGKITPQNKKALRVLEKKELSLPEGKRETEKSIIVKVRKEPKTASPIIRKTRASGLLTILEENPPKPKEMTMHDLEDIRISKTEIATVSEINPMDKIQKHHGFPIKSTVTEKENNGVNKFTGIIKPLRGKITQHKEKVLRHFRRKDVSLPAGRLESEKALIGTVNNELISSVSDVKDSMGFLKYRQKKVVNYLASSAEKKGNQKENFNDILGRIDIDQFDRVAERIRIEKNIGLLEPFSSNAVKEMDNDADVNNACPLEEEKTVRQKESLKKALAENSMDRKISQKYTTIRNAADCVPLDRPTLRINRKPFDELQNKFTKKTQQFNCILTPVNAYKISRRRLFRLEADKNLRPPSPYKLKTDYIVKDFLKDMASGDLPDGKNNTSNNKIKSKPNVIKNNHKAEHIVGDGVYSDSKKLEKKFVGDVKKNPVKPFMPNATNIGFQKLEAANLYTPYIDTEYMTPAQKSVLQVLSTYLAHIEEDLISDNQ